MSKNKKVVSVEDDFVKLNHIIKNSPFNRMHYKVSTSINEIFNTLDNYLINIEEMHLKDKEIPKNLFPIRGIPKYQRNNDKWTQEMQRSFVENIFLGASSEILLCSIEENLNDSLYLDCKVLDGLQRLTALKKFVDNELEIFNGKKREDFERNNMFKRNIADRLVIKIYSFNNEKEAVKFYIAMNRNITHSNEDIKRAETYLRELKTK
ncbi:MAG: hypothetical protein [Bacteriophage sp.]|nr:MAG: hypothetical protein [Bacteriophage sp.]